MKLLILLSLPLLGSLIACKTHMAGSGSSLKIDGGSADSRGIRTSKTKFIEVKNSYGETWKGSGGWLSDRLFLTALHVINDLGDHGEISISNGPRGGLDKATFKRSELIFHHTQDAAAYVANSENSHYTDYFGIEDAHDFALIEVPHAVAEQEDILELSRKGAQEGDRVFVSGCSDLPGRYKKCAFAEIQRILGGYSKGHTLQIERPIGESPSEFPLFEGGDSGAPVLNEDGKLIGIITSGKARNDIETKGNIANLAGMLPEIEESFRHAMPNFVSPRYDANFNAIELAAEVVAADTAVRADSSDATKAEASYPNTRSRGAAGR